MSRRNGLDEQISDQAPFSRLFIVCDKQVTNADIEEAFSEYGNPTEVKVVKNFATGVSKGVAYVTFPKTSQAALALENLDGKRIGSKPIKVLVSSKNKNEEDNESSDEKYRRLFIVVPKHFVEADVREVFSEYGKIEQLTIPKDKDTSENKGVAFVKYSKFSECALAFENVDKKYKALFAEPRRSKQSLNEQRDGHLTREFHPPPLPPPYRQGPIKAPPHPITDPSAIIFRDVKNSYSNNCPTQLRVATHPSLNEDKMWKLFDIIPGLQYCELETVMRQCKIFSIVYSSPQSAWYAKEKLNDFEYPFGEPLNIEFQNGSSYQNHLPDPATQKEATVKLLMERISEATQLLKTTMNNQQVPSTVESFCDVELPSPKPLAPPDSVVKQRCFIVCQPHAPQVGALRDLFSRFGFLIDLYILPGKNYGYAMYACEESAKKAMEVLHGATVYGNRLKVLEAEKKKEDGSSSAEGSGDQQRKRFKIDNAA